MDPANEVTGNELRTRDVLKGLALPVYVPAFMVNGGTAMLIPILPIYLREVGLSFTVVSIVVAASGIGGVVSQVPFGRLITRVGETKTMATSVVVMALAAALLGATAAAVLLVALRFVWGIGSVGWLLSRQTFLTRTVDSAVRGRAMSLFGGVTRLSVLAGPLFSGALAAWFGLGSAFVATGIVTAIGLVPLAMWTSAVDPAESRGARTRQRLDFSAHSRTLAVAGGAQILVMAARQGRFIVLPLIGSEVGLEIDEIGALIAIGSFADLLLFPVAGYLMDRFGRLAAIVPAFGLLAIGLFVLAALPTSSGIVIAAVIMGIGNGVGSGSMLTVASDLAPPASPSEFLGALGTIRDAGKILGPLAVGVLADSAGLSTSAAVLGFVAVGAVAMFVFAVGETRDSQIQKPAPYPPSSI